MFTEWQLSPAPVSSVDEEQERQPILARLLEESEREVQEAEAKTVQPQPTQRPNPRPFAYD